jgi:hypothetical protein
MRLRLIAELQLTHKSEIDPVSQAKKRDRVQKLYFYDLPEIIQKAAFADMSYDDFAEAKIWNGAYFLKTKDGQEFGYNPDGTRWKPVLEASDYDGLEDADEFGVYEDQIEKQAVITRELQKQLWPPRGNDRVGNINSPPQNNIAIINLMNFYEGGGAPRVEYHFFEVDVTPWNEPEIFATFDEAVERCKPFAKELINTALVFCQETLDRFWRWPRETVGSPIGQAEHEELELMALIQAGDLNLALQKILV